MRYSFNWLKELLPLEDVSFSDLLSGLSGIGLHSETVITEGDDYIFELEIPANRGDLLSAWGLSREISALFQLPGPAFPFHPKREGTAGECGFKVKITALEGCPFYSGCLVSDVNLAAAPEKMAGRIKALGLRSLSNVVDITNYILLEMGQPLHAFDADQICGGIEVRFARPGEVLTTLDGEERKLNEGILVIADSVKVLALAGIMGGKESEVTEKTRNVFLESAYFQPKIIRSGRKSLSLETESSVRFERGVDPDLVVAGLERARNLLREAAGGKAGPNVKSGRLSRSHPAIFFHPPQLNNVLGIQISAEEAESILKRIGCSVKDKNRHWSVSAPSYRRDLETEVDLIEEVARFHGYGRITSVLPRVQLLSPGPAVFLKKAGELKGLLVSAGFDEVITTSFSVSGAPDFPDSAPGVQVLNPLSQEQKSLRESVLPALIQTALHNLNRGNPELRFFELGRVYRTRGSPEGQGFFEENRLGLVTAGRKEDLLTLKSLIRNVAKYFGMDRLEIGPADLPNFNSTESASLVLPDGREFAVFGAIPTGKGLLLAAEIYVDSLSGLSSRPVRFNDWPKVPAVVRDYSFLVPELLSWAEIERTVCGLSELISKVTFFDLYKSSEYPSGFQSVAFSVCFQSPERTLTGSEIDLLQKNLVSGLEKMGLKFRGGVTGENLSGCPLKAQ